MGIRTRHQAAAFPDQTGVPAVALAPTHLPDPEPQDASATLDLPAGPEGRARVMDRLRQCLMRAARHGDYRFAVLAVDVDRLKVINETLGRVAGDELLAAVAARLGASVRGLDLVVRTDADGGTPGEANEADDPAAVARVGSDEFVLVLDGIADGTAVVRVAERVRQNLARPFTVGGEEVFCSASIGIALGDARYERPEDLLRDAESAQYHAKAAGPGRFQIFDPEQHAAVVARWRLENELRHAIDRGELLLHFQPIVALDSGESVELEALVRWRRPDRGLVPPAEFIPLAEETGLIVPLGDWVVGEACRQLRRWRDQFSQRPWARHLSVGVNVSPRQFAEPGMVDRVAAILRAEGLSPRDVRLEITESAVMQDAAAARANLDRLRELDFLVHLDDFGTGYSSLACLHRLPISALKIDRSFVSTLATDPASGSLVQTIVTLANRLELQVIAEGIETEGQRAWLRKAGVGCGQGYLFAKPLDDDKAAEFLAARDAAPRAAVA